jgi:hypothetical protein
VNRTHLIFESESGSVSSEPVQLRIWTRLLEDLHVARGDHSPLLALQRPGHYRGAAGFLAAVHHVVDKRDKCIVQAHRDLLAHTNMVPVWDQPDGPPQTLAFVPARGSI